MLFARLLQFLDTYASLAAQPPMGLGQTISATLAPDWDALREQVGGRLFQSTPFAEACFSESFDSAKCIAARRDYRDEEARTNNPAGYTQTQWETCQATSQQCLLDYRLPDKQDPTTRHKQCFQGSVPSHFIHVQQPSDISAAFKFSKQSQVPLVIKNTGHDYMGRSSAPGSLALWMHNLKDMAYEPAFVPDGCHGPVTPRTAITLGAGVQWGEAYAFAERHNVTLVGGADKTVGAVGGWLQGGGHGALSNTMGLGADRVLQYKVVTPDGQHRVVNECQHEDLFFALRGGGGGTFGVVTEATILASPRVTLQTLILALPKSSSPGANTPLTQEMWTILADNSLRWSKAGWGGFSTANVVVLINPILGAAEAAESVAPLTEFAGRVRKRGVEGVQVSVREFGSWGGFFEVFSRDFVATIGSSLALASRLIPKSSFSTSNKRSSLVQGLLAANAQTPGLIMLMTAPASVLSSGLTSVTEAWSSSLYHVTVIAPWNWNATKEEKRARYADASSAIDNLRRITPDAAYLNEADVYEPNYQVAFWGSHYPELLRIKQKYDPDHLLDCWHCVGWNPKSSQFSCYL